MTYYDAVKLAEAQRYCDNKGLKSCVQIAADDVAAGTCKILTPEPSPQERALDEFVARRVAKHGALWTCGECGAGFLPNDDALGEHMAMHDAANDDRGRALDRAMSKLGPHDTDIHTRLMPYRG